MIFKELRERAGLTQRQVADHLGIHVQMISKIERGVSPIPFKHIDKLAKLYKTHNSLLAMAYYDWKIKKSGLELENG